MRNHSTVNALLLGISLLVGNGCGPSRAQTDGGVPPPGQRTRIVTAEDIAESGARSTWEAIRRTIPGLDLYEAGGGRPYRIYRRGRSSVYLDDQTRVMVDHSRLDDLGLLNAIPVGELLSLELLSPVEANTRYGIGGLGGLIVIRTRTGP